MKKIIKIKPPNNKDYLIHKNGSTQDIINAILYADSYNDHVNAKDMSEVARKLYNNDPVKTLFNVWDFVRKNIIYVADTMGQEKIKDVKVLWKSKQGDCKSFSLMIGSILHNYKNINFSYRFVGYKSTNIKNPDFTHVYIIATVNNNNYILDSTINKFNYEEKNISIYKDYPMTKIIHMTGTQNDNATNGSYPVNELNYKNAPKKAIRVKNLPNVHLMTEGELSINLLLQSLEIDENYYGKSKDIEEAKIILTNTLNKNNNFSKDQIVTPLGLEIFNQAEIYAAKTTARAITIPNPNTTKTINGPEETNRLLSECFKKFPGANGYVSDLNLYQNLYHNYQSIKKIEGFEGYKGNNPSQAQKDLDKCLYGVLTIPEFFNTDKFVQGSHQLLYAFNNNKYKDVKVITKSILHESTIYKMSNISGLSVENVRLYIANGIKQTAAKAQLSKIDPVGNIDLLAEARYLDNSQIKGPSAELIKELGNLIKVLSAAVVAVLGAIALLRPDKAGQLKSDGYDNTSVTPNTDDFDKAIKQIEKANNYLLIAAAVAAGGLFLLPSKNK